MVNYTRLFYDYIVGLLLRYNRAKIHTASNPWNLTFLELPCMTNSDKITIFYA